MLCGIGFLNSNTESSIKMFHVLDFSIEETIDSCWGLAKFSNLAEPLEQVSQWAAAALPSVNRV